MRERFYGNEFNNKFEATTVIRESFYGRGGHDRFSIFHWKNDLGEIGGADLSDRFFGGSGNDWLEKLDFDFTSGIRYDQYRQLSFDGGRGYDTISSDVKINVVGGLTLDLDEIQTSALSVEHWNYDIILEKPQGNGEFVIRAGALDDTLNIVQKEGAGQSEIKVETLGGNDAVHYFAEKDVGTLRVNTGNGDDYFEFSAKWGVSADLRVSTGQGNDTVVINGSTVSYPEELSAVIRTGKGHDTIVLEGMHSERLFAGAGSDDIYILTGSFSNAADIIATGGGRDRLFVELDAYSTVAIVEDFSAAKDVFVFDTAEAGGPEPRNTEVTFDRTEWEEAGEDRLYMDNDGDTLYYGSNVLVDFTTDVELTAANFTTGDWEY